MFRSNIRRRYLDGSDFCQCHSESYLITTKLTFLLNNYEVTLTTAFWKTSYRWRFYEHGLRYILILSSRFKKISWNENQRRCLENYHSQKNTTPHLKEHCTKIDDIWLVILRFFFFSQTNLVFTDIFDSFCHSLFTFLPFDFWYSTYFRCSTEFIQCPYAFFIKTNNVLILKMFLLYLNFHETFFPVNGESNFWR